MKAWIFAVFLLILSVFVMADQAEDNKDRAIRMHELINERDFDALDEIIAEDVMRHSAATIGTTVSSLAQFKEFLRADLTASPDARVEIDQIIAVGDMVALRGIYRGTQTGPMGPYPPSGKTFELPYIGMLRFDNEKIVEM